MIFTMIADELAILHRFQHLLGGRQLAAEGRSGPASYEILILIHSLAITTENHVLPDRSGRSTVIVKVKLRWGDRGNAKTRYTHVQRSRTG